MDARTCSRDTSRDCSPPKSRPRQELPGTGPRRGGAVTPSAAAFAPSWAQLELLDEQISLQAADKDYAEAVRSPVHGRLLVLDDLHYADLRAGAQPTRAGQYNSEHKRSPHRRPPCGAVGAPQVGGRRGSADRTPQWRMPSPGERMARNCSTGFSEWELLLRR